MSLFSLRQKPAASPAVNTPNPPKSAHAHPLDALTDGVFSAATSGDRSARLREWLATEPSAEHMSEVFKELSQRDRGAAKPLKEKLDELKRQKAQEQAGRPIRVAGETSEGADQRRVIARREAGFDLPFG